MVYTFKSEKERLSYLKGKREAVEVKPISADEEVAKEKPKKKAKKSAKK